VLGLKAAPMARRIQVRPCFESTVAGMHRNCVELPLQLSRFRIIRLKESWSIEIVAFADRQMIADNDRRLG